ncbi:MAG: hypothetical protein QM642_06300 [Edaphocola sp.]
MRNIYLLTTALVWLIGIGCPCWAQNSWKPNKFFGTMGMQVGGMMLYNTEKESGYTYTYMGSSSVYTPQGLCASLEASSKDYSYRLVANFLAGDVGDVGQLNISALIGRNYYKKYGRFNASAGLGYYYVYPGSGSNRLGSDEVRTVGLTFEASAMLIPVAFFTIGPHASIGITPQGYSVAAGLQLGWGKIR